jgi:ABC-2 type transport system ATP-binding protein
MNNQIIVKTDKLSRKFGNFYAVKEVSIRVKKGEIFGFLGANGAGKTTMIRMLCGLLKPSNGSGTVAGYDVFSQTESIKRSIGYMSQKFSLYNDLSIEENIDFYGGVYGLNKSQIARKKDEIFEKLNLSRWKEAMTGDLPPGFKQGLALGTAMIHDPLIVFLDEPTSGVDPASRRKFWEVINQTAARGVTVFVTTHFMDEAEYCNRISIMNEGIIVALDSPETLKNQYQQPDIQNVFLSMIRNETDGNE